jgi:outer membrane receptor for ferrienterochelin and colicins
MIKFAGINIAFLLILIVSNALAQIKLEGTVYEGKEGGSADPIPGVTVYLPQSKVATTTNAEGFFTIEVPAEEELIIFRFVGLKVDTLQVKELKTPVTIVMQDGKVLPDVVIRATKKGFSYQRFSARDGHIMNEGEIRKAACCNLSESFETNPSIDANYTDAVTGTKQIQMLGLSGKYVQIMQDNVPMVRGLSTTYGLEFIPGAWVNSIQVSKGAGSVVNGYESMTGQINVGMKNPETGEKLHVNYYVNSALRNELNIHSTLKVNKHWTTTLLGHAKYSDRKVDNNGDGFIDAALSNTFIFQNQWNYSGPKIHSEIGIGAVSFNSKSGQYHDAIMSAGNANHSTQLTQQILENPYLVNNYSGKVNGFIKLGYLFPDHPYKSAAIQLNASQHTQLSQFGVRVYNGEQTSGYGNLIFQNYLGESEEHKYKTGASIVYDKYDEQTRRILATDTSFAWQEIVPGAYFEYSMNKTLVSMIAGVRADYHNIYGAFLTPRFNMRYSFSENNSLKLAAGMGRRTPNIFMENIGAMASSRTFEIQGDQSNSIYGLSQEVAQNYGLGFHQEFQLFKRDASFNLDFYHTRFNNQIVADYDFDSRKLILFNLTGNSISNSAQVEFSFEPAKRWEVRTAYRWLDVQTDYLNGTLSQPLTATHRGFINVGKETRKDKKGSHWKMDATMQVIGQQRIPQTLDKPEEYQIDAVSKPYTQLNAQVTYVYQKKWEFYVGGENLTNFKINNPILSSENPWGEDFDASMVWGPIFGRMAYFGVRFTIE